MFETQIEVLIHTVHTISLPSKDMGRESIEEGELSTPLVAKEEHYQVYASGDHLGCANSSGCDDVGESQNGSP